MIISIDTDKASDKIQHKDHMIISIDTDKASDKIQHSSTIKTLNTLGIEGMYLNIIKVINEKHTPNIILNGEKMEALSLRSGIRVPTITPSIQHSTESSSQCN